MSTFYGGDQIVIIVESASGIKSNDSNGLTDAYVQIPTPRSTSCFNDIKSEGFAKTDVVKKSLNPQWVSNNTFIYYLLSDLDNVEIKFELYDWNRFTKNVSIDQTVLTLQPTDFITNKSTNKILNWEGSGTLKLDITYKPGKAQVSSTSTIPATIPTVEFNDMLYKQFKFGSALIPLVPKEEKLDEIWYDNKNKYVRCAFDKYIVGLRELDAVPQDLTASAMEFVEFLIPFQQSVAKTLVSTQHETIVEESVDVSDQFSSRFQKVLKYQWKLKPALQFATPYSFTILIGFTESSKFVESLEFSTRSLEIPEKDFENIKECLNKSILMSRSYDENSFPNKFKDRTPRY